MFSVNALHAFLLIILLPCYLSAQDKPDSADYAAGSGGRPVYVTYPSSWIQRDINRLNTLELISEYEVDTLSLYKEMRRLSGRQTIMERDFYTHVHALNLRTIFDIKMELAAMIKKIKTWQHRMRRWNDELTGKTLQIEKISSETRYFRAHGDSLLQLAYAGEVRDLEKRQQASLEKAISLLGRYTRVEDSLNNFSEQVFDLYNDTDEALHRRELYLMHRELPPIWRAGQQDYTASFASTVKTSFFQTLENIRFYAESSIAQLVLFRLLIFFLCLMPLRIFKQKKSNLPIRQEQLMFLGKYPSLASSVMGMALAPVIFIDAPHSFLELIFISLTALVGYLTWKEHPYLNKWAFSVLIISFFLMFLLNFFVTATFAGRIMFSLSVFLLIPLWVIFREIPDYPIKRKKALRVFIAVMAAHILLGWVLTITGNYTLGKSLVLVAFDTMILSMMFYVALHSLLDYLMILTALFNARNHHMRINGQVVHDHLRPLFIFCSVVLIVLGYLINTNLYDVLVMELSDFFVLPRTIGNATFTYGSIAVFLGSVFLAFYIAGLLRNMLDTAPQENKEHRKSNIGSYLLLGRFLIICGGLMIGVIASGVSLNNFTIVLGAVGVGIGFGLQNIASNLLSGIIIVFEKPFVVGDRLEVEHELGRVKEIGLRATRISIIDGSEVLIPNGKLLASDLKNWTLTNNLRRLELLVPADQDADAAQVIKVLRQAAEEQHEVKNEPAVIVELSGMQEDQLLFAIYFWIDDNVSRVVIKGSVLQRVHELFREHQISYPRRDIWINREP